jgi:hypothetical protein
MARSPIVTDTFYCPDGSTSVAFDNTGKRMSSLGVNRLIAMEPGHTGFLLSME